MVQTLSSRRQLSVLPAQSPPQPPRVPPPVSSAGPIMGAPRTRNGSPTGTQDPGWLPSGHGFMRKDIRNDVQKKSEGAMQPIRVPEHTSITTMDPDKLLCPSLKRTKYCPDDSKARKKKTESYTRD
ncbi:hypothetical protein QTO34_018402 [Cnephaeus nilssonii]|uniref:Uncharacterized protein n=1 Tax=Cnephaeus nilssonii TaxID=3371016 RepID=A0AA40HYS0_CNENI|nr:hypothetical protein QTO34_018402 [Eptesicus nilssonii]